MIKNFFKKFLHYLSFGLKVAETEMLVQKESSESDNEGIVEIQQENRLSKDLLNAEVTQQVEELRYRNYQVYRESNNYQYLGDGVSIKKEKQDKGVNYSFSINNNLICGSILDGFNAIEKNDFGIDKYTLTFSYFDIPRFRLESYCTSVDVDVVGNSAYLSLHFSAFYDKYDNRGRTFINELSKLENITNEYEVKRNELCSNINKLSLTTYKASNEDDLIHYCFNEIEYLGYEQTNSEFILKYFAKTFDKIDLIDKFYSESMYMKYQRNENKGSTISILPQTRREVCSICGKEMHTYDADITKITFGYTMCTECLENKLKKENKIES